MILTALVSDKGYGDLLIFGDGLIQAMSTVCALQAYVKSEIGKNVVCGKT